MSLLYMGIWELEPITKRMGKALLSFYQSKDYNEFRFRSQPTNFEVIDHKIFAEVLYPKDLHDLIDFQVRACVKRAVRMRVCRNCLRYFAVTGKASTEYCDRVCDSGAITPEDFSRWLKESRERGAAEPMS